MPLSSWLPTRELQLIDLSDSDFGVHNNAAHALTAHESTALTQRWARALFEQFGARIDGLLHDSTIIGDKVAVLFTPAREAYPAAPAFYRPLDHVDVAGFVADVGHRLRWRLLRRLSSHNCPRATSSSERAADWRCDHGANWR